MQTLTNNSSWLTQGTISSSRRVPIVRVPQWRGLQTIQKLKLGFLLLIIAWVGLSVVLQLIDPAIGVLDFGTLTVAVFGLLVGWLAIYISTWLQEMLWHPFKSFRKQFGHHFNQLSSWQQCIIYFSVFFLLLYAVIMVMVVVF
ncbi:hypothetical protein [Sphingobacterium paucimobilis]|uniref:Uncharacterized protein n=1 Tax=Sphingobacterium paucimobilis HER1398 TaxID=1346330 RepID=U2J5K3_9SPHI|nr:hypothetical protein [Sphingobacterium paucimobilis]ERJ57943.1 hypothetical protein M472_04105 [Sphingobacterium paucimobilis HER1398]